MSRVIAYIQAGGFGSRLYPLLHQPGMKSVEALSAQKRNLMPFNHNSYYAVAKPVMPYFGISLCEPLVRRAVMAGVEDLRITIHNLPDTVIEYYVGRQMSANQPVYMGKFLYEATRLDTAGGIVRDVVADMKDGTIKPDDTILVLGGDIRTDIDIADFLAEHQAKQADISIALAQVPRDEMYRFGASLREGDQTPTLGALTLSTKDGEKQFDVYGNLALNPEKVARIVRFFEKAPKLDPAKVTANPAQLMIDEILAKHGVGALSPTDLQNGSVYAIRAELIYHLAPLVFNLDREASASSWRETSDINLSGASRYSDFGGDWFMTLTGSKPMPAVDAGSGTAELKSRIIEDLQSAPPQIFGYKIPGYWSDDGTLPSVLSGHFKILDDLVKLGREADWPINWSMVKMGLPQGIITMSNIRGVLREITLHPPVFIEDEVTIQPGAELGPYAIIGRGWEVGGKVVRSILFPKKRIDRIIESGRGWKRFVIPPELSVEGSIVGSGIESVALDHEGNPVSSHRVRDAVVVSNGSQNVISPINI